jgi:hypothetical protein
VRGGRWDINPCLLAGVGRVWYPCYCKQWLYCARVPCRLLNPILSPVPVAGLLAVAEATWREHIPLFFDTGAAGLRGLDGPTGGDASGFREAWQRAWPKHRLEASGGEGGACIALVAGEPVAGEGGIVCRGPILCVARMEFR